MEEQTGSPADLLRAELKAWERAFSEKHQGRKATRDEIKRHPEIAQKYKNYNNLRSRISDATAASSSSPPPPKRRKPSPPTQKSKLRTQSHPSILDPYDSPRKSSEIHLTPTKHDQKWVGPTPQKNGVAIGLFDLLSPELSSKRTITPSRKLAGIDVSAQTVVATPTKRQIEEIEEIERGTKLQSQMVLPQSKYHPSRTPQSVSKRLYLSQFLAANTPSRSRGSNPETPSSGLRRGAGAVSKLILGETPEFLKRDSKHAFSLMIKREGQSRPGTADGGNLGEDLAQKGGIQPLEWSPVAVRLPRKSIGRTLSSLVQNLRDAQEQELDKDLEVLREIENESSTNANPKRPKLLIRDSQVQEPMPLGPEDLGFESLGEEVQGHEISELKGENRKVWKKKGQKRTTRRVIMRPVLSKWQPEQEWQAPSDGENEVVEESQLAAKPITNNEKSGNEFDGEGSNDDDGTASIQQSKKVPEIKVAVKPKDKGRDAESKNLDKKGRKTGRAQPQNFKALKMRNKGNANGIGKAKSKFGKGGFRRR